LWRRAVGLQLNAAAPTTWQTLTSLVMLVFLIVYRHLPWTDFVRAIAMSSAR